jgi:hypothetical protein
MTKEAIALSRSPEKTMKFLLVPPGVFLFLKKNVILSR